MREGRRSEKKERVRRSRVSSDLQQLHPLMAPLFEAQDRLILHLHSCTGERLKPANTHTDTDTHQGT